MISQNHVTEIWGQNSILGEFELKQNEYHIYSNPRQTWKHILPLPKLFSICELSNLGAMKKVILLPTYYFQHGSRNLLNAVQKSDLLQRVQ